MLSDPSSSGVLSKQLGLIQGSVVFLASHVNNQVQRNTTSPHSKPQCMALSTMMGPHQNGLMITHPNHQSSYVIVDDFANPWTKHDTILIQHGFARHSAFWYHWVPALAGNYRVIRRDARGHGRSSVPAIDGSDHYEYSIDVICEEIIDTLDQLGIETTHFFGESTSGMVGEYLAAKYPTRIKSLTICSAPTYLPSTALDLFAFGNKDWPDACLQLGSRGWGEALSRIPGTVPTDNPDYLRWWIDQVAISKAAGLAGYARFLSGLDSRPVLSSINIPCLILAPANSAATKVEEQKMIASQIRGAELVVINGPGHEIYVNMAKECQAAFLLFLKSLDVVKGY